jgi:GNAT superfamily N-acetyltransferase
MTASVTFRTEPRPSDADAIRRLATAAGNFSAEEIDVAVELVEERLAKGRASGYDFVFADRGGETLGYVCYGPIACTVGSFDLYWIVVDPAWQGRGLGRRLMGAVEAAVRCAGGRRLYIDTSTSAAYAPTRAFYTRCGYAIAAELPDFYSPGDGKVIFVRALA